MVESKKGRNDQTADQGVGSGHFIEGIRTQPRCIYSKPALVSVEVSWYIRRKMFRDQKDGKRE